MVRQIKFTVITLCVLTLLTAFGGAVSAQSYTVYDGNPSGTYIQYFRDILPNISIGDNYIAFRSEQNTYVLVVGSLEFSNGVFSSSDSCTVYTIESNNTYNGYYSYSVGEIDSFQLNPSNKIIYSDLGNYPHLDERGTKYEILIAILIAIICVSNVTRFILRPR